MNCPFCKTSAFGCAPGRCFSPNARHDDHDKPPERPAKVSTTPLGKKRLVLISHRRAGPNGGGYWVSELECGHVVWRRGGKHAPKTETCIDCSEPLTMMCACGCGTTADIHARQRGWIWIRRQWLAPRCAQRFLGRILIAEVKELDAVAEYGKD